MLADMSLQLTDISRNIQIETIGYYLSYTIKKGGESAQSLKEGEKKEWGRRMMSNNIYKTAEHFLLKSYFLCMTCMCESACGVRAMVYMWRFSVSAFMWILRIELGRSGLLSKYLICLNTY